MGINVVPDKGLNGNINIHSPLPTNNTIRYIELEITNEDGVEARKVTVAQYPLEYITNIQGWYSSREDFGSTWENPRGTPKQYLPILIIVGMTSGPILLQNMDRVFFYIKSCRANYFATIKGSLLSHIIIFGEILLLNLHKKRYGLLVTRGCTMFGLQLLLVIIQSVSLALLLTVLLIPAGIMRSWYHLHL